MNLKFEFISLIFRLSFFRKISLSLKGYKLTIQVVKNLLLFLFLFFSSFLGAEEDLALQAKKWIEAGNNAENMMDQENFYESALISLLQMDPLPLTKKQKGELWENVAYLYQVLGDNSYAALYFSRVLSLYPENKEVEEKLQNTLFKLGIQEKVHFFSYLPFVEPLLFPLFFITFFLLSFWIWTNVRIWIVSASITGALMILCFLFVVAERYFSPIKGMVVQATDIHTQKKLTAETVTSEPMIPGTYVDVINRWEKESVMKIRTEKGLWGYIPIEAVQII